MANGMKLFLNKAAVGGLGFGQALQQRGENERAMEAMQMRRQQMDQRQQMNQQMLPIRQMGAEAQVLNSLTQAQRLAMDMNKNDPVTQTTAALRRIAEEHAKKGDAQAAGAIMAGIQEGSARLAQVVGSQGQGITDRKVKERSRIAGSETAARQAGILKGRMDQQREGVLFAPSASMTPEDRIAMERAKAEIGMGKAIGTQAAKTRFTEDPELASDPAAVQKMSEGLRPLIQPQQVDNVKVRARQIYEQSQGQISVEEAFNLAEQEMGGQ